jgi:hypothetical protein
LSKSFVHAAFITLRNQDLTRFCTEHSFVDIAIKSLQLFALIIFACIIDKCKPGAYCVFNDSHACNYGIWLGVFAWLISMVLLAAELFRDALGPMRRTFAVFELFLDAALAFFWCVWISIDSQQKQQYFIMQGGNEVDGISHRYSPARVRLQVHCVLLPARPVAQGPGPAGLPRVFPMAVARREQRPERHRILPLLPPGVGVCAAGALGDVSQGVRVMPSCLFVEKSLRTVAVLTQERDVTDPSPTSQPHPNQLRYSPQAFSAYIDYAEENDGGYRPPGMGSTMQRFMETMVARKQACGNFDPRYSARFA